MIDIKPIGSPRAWDLHQKIILKTIINMMPEVERHMGWDILPEALVTEDPNDNYPDIIIKDEHKRLIFSMEITRKAYISYDRRKCLQLQQRFPWAEFYIYNYETDLLYALGDDGQWFDSKNYDIMSRLFTRPLLDYIYVPEVY